MSNLPSPVFSNDNECHVIILENEPYNRSQCTSPDGFSFTRPRSVTIMESDEVDINKKNNLTGILKHHSTPSTTTINDSETNNSNINSTISLPNNFRNIFGINHKSNPLLIFLNKYKCGLCTIIFILLLLSVIGLSISLGIITPLSKLFCTSKACISSASRLSEYINKNDDICKNPYNVICENVQEWKYDDKYSDYITKFSSKPQYFIETIKIIYSDILNILNDLTSDINDSISFKVSKTLYDGCMNNNLRRNQGTEPLKELLKTLPCGPILNECITFNESNYSLETSIGLFGFYAKDLNIIYYNEDIDPDYDGKVILSFSPPDLTNFLDPYRRQLESTEFDNFEFRQNLLIFAVKNLYKEYVTNILNISKYNDKEIEEVAKFTIKLENFTTTMNSYNSNFKVLTIDDLNRELGSFDVMTFLDSDISNTNTWNGTNRILVNNIEYFKHLNLFLKTYKPQTIADYLTMVSTINLAKYTSSSDLQNDSWEKCIDDIQNIETTVAIYNNKYGINAGAENKIKNILLKLRNFYIDTHTSFPSELHQKIRNMNIEVGVPPQMKSLNTIDDIYSKVHLNSSDYFSTMLRILKRQRDYRILNIGTTIDTRNNGHWKPLYPEIIYDEHENTIFIPLAILKLPLLDGNYNDNWITISSLGFLYIQKLSEIVWNSIYEASYKEEFFNCLVSKSSISSFGSSASKIGTYTLQNTDSLQTIMNYMAKNGFINENERNSNIPGFSEYSFYELALLQSSTFMCYKKNPSNIMENIIHEQSMFYSLNEMDVFSRLFNCTEEVISNKNCFIF
uniref:Peptidase_M13_N domain-containing protein n=1 Tax=Strongyloides papillosus TaxID=174720 RepID=A0A0N5CDB2_STREA